jgi:hypothetical protein
VVSEGIRGSLSEQAGGQDGALQHGGAAKLTAVPAGSVGRSRRCSAAGRGAVGVQHPVATALHPIWYDAVLKPLTGWQFNAVYDVELTKFTCPRGIDLEAASTP